MQTTGGYFMSENDQAAAVGRLVQSYSEHKTKLIALKTEARRLIGQLNQLSATIDHYETAPINIDLSFIKNTDFQKLVLDLQATEREKRNLEQKLKELGLNIRD